MRSIICVFLILLLCAACTGQAPPSAPTTETAAIATTSAPAMTSAATTQILTTAGKAPTVYAGEDAYNWETDYPYSMYSALTTKMLVETEAGYYFYYPSCLFYMDKDALEPTPVCSKPNCLHYEETDVNRFRDCDAYFDAGLLPRLGWYDGHIYIMTQIAVKNGEWFQGRWAIVRVSPDGTERKTVWIFDEGFGAIEGMIIHRGVMYYVTRQNLDGDEKQGKLWALSLERDHAEPECILETSQHGAGNATYGLTAYGNRLYLIRGVSSAGQKEICIIDLRSRKNTTIPQTEEGYNPVQITFLNGKMLVLERDTVLRGDPEYLGSYPGKLYSCTLDGSEREVISEKLGYYTADSDYLYCAGMLFGKKDANPFIYIYDSEMEEVDRIDVNTFVDASQASYIVCDASWDDQVILEVSAGDASGYYWFSKSEIGTGQIQVRSIFTFDDQKYSDFGRQ